MSRKSTLTLAGLLLIGVSALWFFTPVSDIVLETVQADRAASPEARTRGLAPPPGGVWDTVQLAFDGLNAFFGAIGFYLTIRGLRSKSPSKENA